MTKRKEAPLEDHKGDEGDDETGREAKHNWASNNSNRPGVLRPLGRGNVLTDFMYYVNDI